MNIKQTASSFKGAFPFFFFFFFVLLLKLKTVRDSGVQHCGAQENNSQVPGVLIIVLFQSGIKYKGDKSVSTRVEGR